jgi:hypothetical protein
MMTRPTDRWTLDVRRGEIDLWLIRKVNSEPSLRVTINNSEEVMIPRLVAPGGRLIAEGTVGILKYLDLVHQSKRA